MLTSTDGGKDLHLARVGQRLHHVQHRPAGRQPEPERLPGDVRQRAHRHQRLLRRPARRPSDRKLGNTPDTVFLADCYDISDLAGADARRSLRFSYATDPGLARPGWFIDDVKVTATRPTARARDLRHRLRDQRRHRRPARLQRRLPGGPGHRRRVHPGLAVRRGRRRGARRTTPTTSRCATAPASTSTATARPTAAPIAFAGRASTRLHRRGARLRQRRHRRPAGPVAARLPARAGQRHAGPQRRGVHRRRRRHAVLRRRRRARPTTTPTRAARRATGSSTTTA